MLILWTGFDFLCSNGHTLNNVIHKQIQYKLYLVTTYGNDLKTVKFIYDSNK